MQPASFPAPQRRSHYRHELRSLTYVTLDEANGGIIRNLNHEGAAVQAVEPLRERQCVHLRFDLRFPRLRVETCGQVSWTSPSGQCGIRFIDLPAHTSLQIDEWIFSNMLDAAAREAADPRPIFGATVVSIAREEKVREENVREETREETGPAEEDGLTLSATPRPVIRLEPRLSGRDETQAPHRRRKGDRTDPVADAVADRSAEMSWLSRPLSGRSLAWLVDSLVVIAALLLFALVFLSIAHELPQWRLALAAVLVAVVFVIAAYWSVFGASGGASLGSRLAKAAYVPEEDEDDVTGRFR